MTHSREPTKPCPDCGGIIYGIGEARTAKGDVIYPYYCTRCSFVTSRYASKKAAQSMPDLPRVYTKTERKIAAGTFSTENMAHQQPCEVCGSSGDSELHHWAPWHLFGEESERWPQSYLCRACHLRWHQLVTPNMSNR